jgi:hypothetical protein
VASITVTTGTTTNTLWSAATGRSLYAAGGTAFRYDPTDQQFVFNWQSKSPDFAAGPYTLKVTLSDGGTSSIRLTLAAATGSGKLMADSGDSGGGASDGQLLAGDILRYVDNVGGGFNAAELARVGEVIAGLNALLTPYGVTITTVDAADSAAANILLCSATTCALGCVADGVLGC